MSYLLLKALHVAAVITWTGGTLGQATMLACCQGQDGQGMVAAVDRLRIWDRRVTTPAMLLAWALGLALASLGHWFPQGWLMAKLVCALLLSGLHGMLAGRLRRLVADPPTHAWAGRFSVAAAIVIGTTVIAFLVVVKPHAG